MTIVYKFDIDITCFVPQRGNTGWNIADEQNQHVPEPFGKPKASSYLVWARLALWRHEY
jgi:hypothetical protein